MRHPSVLRVLIALSLIALFLIAASPTFAEPDGGRPDNAPPELAALEFLIGEWDLTASFTQADGSKRESKARLVARYALGGHGITIEETHRHEGGTFVNAVLYTVRPQTRTIVGSSNNSLGNRKLYEVTPEGGRVLITQTGELFGGRQGFNRHVLFNISPDRYELSLDACDDDGTCREGSYSYVAERRK